ncbi:MAG TPA: T9SS type A sorting domain-containing protein [Ignavibacteriales bacterium]|nr:T9SS type A sorting domain-containing protein [Ignavibacteriales bacterium]
MIRFICIIFLNILLVNNMLYSQADKWISIGPEGGEVIKIKAASSNPEIVYSAVNRKSLFRSENGGNSWKMIKWFASLQTFEVDPNVPDKIYAASDYLYLSNDGGIAWQKINTPFTGVSSITADPVISGIIYIPQPSGEPGVWKTENSGQNWIFTPMPEAVRKLEINPARNNDVYAIAGAGASKIYKSTNYGKSFKYLSTVPINGSLIKLLTDPSDSTRLYVSGSEGVYKSVDGGVTWSEKNAGDIDRNHPWTEEIILDPAHTNRVYRSVNNNRTTFLSTDYGESWKYTDLPAGSLTIVSDSIMLSGTRDGVYASNLNCENVRPASKGLNGTTIRSLDISEQSGYKVFALTEDPGIAKANLYTLQAGQGEWQKSFWGRGASMLKVSELNPKLIAGGFNIGSKQISISTDGGDSWQLKAFNGYVFSTAFSSFDSSTIFAGANTGLYKSTDKGQSWTLINFPADRPGFYHDVSEISVGNHDSTIFLCLQAGEDWSLRQALLSSTDMGASWHDHFMQPISVLVVPDQPDIILCSIMDSSKSRLLRSTNRGGNWTEILFPDQPAYVSIITSNNNIIYAGTNQGVLFSLDKGLSWLNLGQGIRPGIITSLGFTSSEPSIVFAGTLGGGIYKFDPEGSTDGVKADKTSFDFSLSNNFPNPFNPKTTISYSLAKNSSVKLAVYDLLGREVTILVDKEQATGQYKVTFDGSSLSSGIYIYTLHAGDFTESRKLLLLK